MEGLIRRRCVSFALVLLTVALMLYAPMVHSHQKRQAQNRSRAKAATPKTTNNQWYTFRGPDNDFTLNFPVKPSRAEDVQGSVTNLRRYASATDTTYFEVSIQDFGGELDSPEANSYDPNFEQMLSQLLGKEGIRIVQIKRTARNVYALEAWSPSEAAGEYLHSLARGVLRNGRQYRMGCNSLLVGREVDRNVCRRFFNSFHFIGARR